MAYDVTHGTPGANIPQPIPDASEYADIDKKPKTQEENLAAKAINGIFFNQAFKECFYLKVKTWLLSNSMVNS